MPRLACDVVEDNYWCTYKYNKIFDYYKELHVSSNVHKLIMYFKLFNRNAHLNQ